MAWMTLGEITGWLVASAALGFALGWLVHEGVVRRRRLRESLQARRDRVVIENPIKGKTRSKIFHVPGSPQYDRTRADVWFETEQEALDAGFRPPKSSVKTRPTEGV